MEVKAPVAQVPPPVWRQFKDLQEWDEDDLRAHFGVVFQDFNQYQLKMRENVGVGHQDGFRNGDGRTILSSVKGLRRGFLHGKAGWRDL